MGQPGAAPGDSWREGRAVGGGEKGVSSNRDQGEGACTQLVPGQDNVQVHPGFLGANLIAQQAG